MVYEIQPYTFKKAKQLGLQVKPSSKAGKKIDVYKQGDLVASIGAAKMGDYPSYIKEKGKAYAEERRRLYKIRHAKNTGVAGKLASELLW